MRSHLPNLLSVSRILSGLILIILSAKLTPQTYSATVCVLTVALLTDGLDGYLARKWKVTTELGYILDSLGDRALHLAMVLIFLIRYGYHPVFAWLLAFRDIGIFAVRVLTKDWLKKATKMQWLSRFYAAILRVWIGLFVMRDGFLVFTGHDQFDTTLFDVSQVALLCVGIVASYYGLLRSFGELIEKDHQTV